MKKESFSITARIKSFKHALNGFKLLVHEEHNFRIHFVAAVLVVFAAFIFQLSKVEWCILLLTIAMVLAAEIFNTSIEIICNIITPEYHPSIKKIKDISAAAVMLCSFVAALIGIILFLQKLVGYL